MMPPDKENQVPAWLVSAATAEKLTASGLGEPREAMGPPAASWFLYGRQYSEQKAKVKGNQSDFHWNSTDWRALVVRTLR
jgi:hypothetical protein